VSALDVFTYSGQEVRTVIIDGEPWFVSKDVCDVLGITKYRDAIGQLDADERVSVAVDTLGGAQQMSAVSESGVLTLALISRSPRVKPFMRWLTHDVIPSITRTGSYAVESAPVQAKLTRMQILELAMDSERRAIVATERAEAAEQFKGAIERNDGLVPRAFHKHYFPEVSDKVFFDLLYTRGLLINQRGKGAQRTDGSYRDGSQHGHPSYQGKQFFYIDAGVSQKTGYRFEQTRVRPGGPELELVQYLTKAGLTPQTASKELAHV
jgi:prophage antirepressor-like protein